MTRPLAITLNALALYAVAIVLLAAFAGQLLLGELPCPLCLLQRILFAMLAIGPMLNIRHGPRPSHYALSLLAAVVGAVVSGRQILLHILPGDPGYGSALFGLHFYTWALIAAVGVVCYVALVFVLKDVAGERAGSAPIGGLASNASFAIFTLLVAANLLSTVLECGAGQCEDNPVRYLLLK